MGSRNDLYFFEKDEAERAEHSIKYNQLLARFRESLSLLEGRVTKETLQLVKEGLEE